VIVILPMLAAALAGLACRRAARRAASPRIRALAGYAAIGLFLAGGLLVLGVGARTWPGLYAPGSRLLSLLLADRRLFESGYAVAVLAAACATARLRIAADPRLRRLSALLGALQALAVVWCVLVAGLGLMGAVLVAALSE
jgi:hypothetical protein